MLALLCSCGNQGYEFVAGPKGDKGDPGLNGSNGKNCSVASLAVGSVFAANGGSLITCPDGSSSVVLNGKAGTNGSVGATGQAGVSGTIITPVKFCAGFTQNYPSTFAESGLCINNKIYGVYSAHDGFLAELPPGNYSSNGINSSCSFTIKANCVVQ